MVDAYGVYMADRNGVVRRVGDVSGLDVTVNQMSWSPDGTTLAFSTFQGTIGGTATITVVGRDGVGGRVLARGSDVGTSFAWTVDSRQVVFATRDRSTTPNRAALLAADVRGGGTRTLVSGTDIIAPIGALADGQRILFWWMGALSVVNLDGSGQHTVVPRAGFGGSLSPNGKLYAFVENSALNVVDVDAERFVVGGPGAGAPGSTGPVRWSPDGSLLAYSSDYSLVVARPDGAAVRTIPDVRHDFRFSPAGDRLAAGTGNLRTDIYDLPGRDSSPGLTNAVFLDWAPSTSLAGIEHFLDNPEDSPDGTGAVCLTTPGGVLRRLVTFLGRTIGSGLRWSPDGAVLAIQVTR